MINRPTNSGQMKIMFLGNCNASLDKVSIANNLILHGRKHERSHTVWILQWLNFSDEKNQLKVDKSQIPGPQPLMIPIQQVWGQFPEPSLCNLHVRESCAGNLQSTFGKPVLEIPASVSLLTRFNPLIGNDPEILLFQEDIFLVASGPSFGVCFPTRSHSPKICFAFLKLVPLLTQDLGSQVRLLEKVLSCFIIGFQ